MIFAYFGPETVLPLASVLATIVGVVMMFGRLTFKFAMAPFQWIFRLGKGRKAESALRGPTAWRRQGSGAEPAESHSAGSAQEG